MKSRIVLAFVFVMGLVAFPMTSIADPTGESQIYAVKVTPANDEPFDDCYIFHPEGSLEIVADTLILAWGYRNNGQSLFRYQGVTTEGNFLSLGVSGVKSVFGINGDEISESGTTYKVRGKRVKQCEITPAPNAASGFHRESR